MNISIFGTGYVGLTYGAVLSAAGHQVLCLDIDAKKIAQLAQGEISVYEPGLADLVREMQTAGRLHFSTDLVRGINFSELLYIAVGTPSMVNGAPDLSAIEQLSTLIANHMFDYKIIVNKSTVPVGTTRNMRDIIERILSTRNVSYPFDIVSNPEFLREGSAIADCRNPDRVIVGCDSPQAKQSLIELYQSIYKSSKPPILVMDPESAELTKYAANSFLATKISFINELALLAERVGADIESVRQGMGLDPRIGQQFLAAGIGYGGGCFPKDLRALLYMANSIGTDAKLLQAVESRNEMQKKVLFNKIRHFFNGDLAGKTIGVWGLSFKPNTSDMREAASITTIQQLLEAGAIIQAYDPVAQSEGKKTFQAAEHFVLKGSKEQAVEGADGLAILTEWEEFRHPNFQHLKMLLRLPVIFDGRNIFQPKAMHEMGFIYHAIGRCSLSKLKGNSA